tara:strand:+ start:410 stop:961 length:552 start_codon:yes stop_codon:yes gene_type:complete
MDAERQQVFSSEGPINNTPRSELTIAWAKGSRFGKADPEKCYEEIVEVAEAFGGIPPEGALMQRAQDKSSAMHELFDWDVDVAARKWGVHTERLIRAQLVYVEKRQKVRKEYQIRVFSKIKETDSEGKSINVFYNTFDVMDDPEMRKQLLERARKDMRTFEQRYRLLKELSSVIDPIQVFLNK